MTPFRPKEQHKKNIGLLVALVFSVVSQLLYSPLANAQFNNVNAPAEWVSAGIISFDGKNFTDSDGPENGSTYTYRVDLPNASGPCTSVFRFTVDPFSDGGGQSALRTLRVPNDAGDDCITLGQENQLVTMQNVENINQTDEEGTGTEQPAEEAQAGEVTCTIGNALGWIICPAAEALQGTTVLLANFIEGFLRTDPLPLNPGALAADDGRRAVYDVWSSLRNLANIVLVFGFFAIVFSQATSIGLSSYGIKKLLPRLLIVAIAINLSYFICAFLIDIFNIIGGGIAGLFAAASGTISSELPQDDVSLGDTVANLLGATAATGGIIFIISNFAAFWPIIVPILVAVAIAFFIAFILLILREVLIIMLIIVSPLAFAAWLLPNTDSWFSKWRSFFTAMLMLYPLMMALVYGSILASNIVGRVTLQGDDGPATEAIKGIIQLALLAIPLGAAPFFIKAFGTLGGRIVGALNNPNKGPLDRAKKWSDARRGENRDIIKSKRNTSWGKRAERGGAWEKAAKARSYVAHRDARRKGKVDTAKQALNRDEQGYMARYTQDSESYQKSLGRIGGESAKTRAVTYAQQSLQTELNNDVKAAISRLELQGKSSDRAALVEVLNSQSIDRATAGAAAQLLLSTGGTEEYRQVLTSSPAARRRDVADALVEAGKNKYDIIDSKSPDVADFIGNAGSAEVIANGGALKGIDNETRSLRLQGSKLLRFEPQSIGRWQAQLNEQKFIMDTAAPGSVESSKASKAYNTAIEQAYIATQSEDFGSAKAPVQEVLRQASASYSGELRSSQEANPVIISSARADSPVSSGLTGGGPGEVRESGLWTPNAPINVQPLVRPTPTPNPTPSMPNPVPAAPPVPPIVVVNPNPTANPSPTNIPPAPTLPVVEPEEPPRRRDDGGNFNGFN